jgi:hypothetical protein
MENKPTVNVSAMEMFNTKRVEGEPDLVAMINKELISIIGTDAGVKFMNNPDIKGIVDLNPISQRIIINRWFNNTLLTYRATNTNKDVSEILVYIINDGTIDDWFKYIYSIVIVFMKNNNVL